MNSCDVIIIGAGHNGLVGATYLARAGRRVLVLERRELVGGCAVSEELWPGFKVSTAYVNRLFRPEIIRDLDPMGRTGWQNVFSNVSKVQSAHPTHRQRIRYHAMAVPPATIESQGR